MTSATTTSTINDPAVYFGITRPVCRTSSKASPTSTASPTTWRAMFPIAMWGMGIYAQDEWSVASNLKLTLAFRAEQNSNPVCQFNCFANLTGPWTSLASFTSSNPGTVPYSERHPPQPAPGIPGRGSPGLLRRALASVGRPVDDHKTVISGGFIWPMTTRPPAWWTTCWPIRPCRWPFRVRPRPARRPSIRPAAQPPGRHPRTPFASTRPTARSPRNCGSGLGVRGPQRHFHRRHHPFAHGAGMEPADAAAGQQ